MDCACSIEMEYEGDSATLYNEKLVTARKEHKCSECGRVILSGERYERVSGLWSGHFNLYKTCSDCVSAREAFFTGSYMFENIWDDISEHIHECQGGISEDCVSSLSPLSRSRVADLIEEYHNEHSMYEEG